MGVGVGGRGSGFRGSGFGGRDGLWGSGFEVRVSGVRGTGSGKGTCAFALTPFLPSPCLRTHFMDGPKQRSGVLLTHVYHLFIS